MMGILGEDRFEVGGAYYDAVGRKWRVSQKFKVNGQPCLIVYYCSYYTLFGRTSNYHPAIIEDGGNTATVLLDEGFTTIYAEEADQ